MTRHISELSPHEIRNEIRLKRWNGTTYGLAKKYAQVSPVILAEKYADDFLRLCKVNPKIFPLYGVSETGNSKLSFLGEDVDVKSDLSSYRVYSNGQFNGNTGSIKEIWQDDFVTFAIGCSLSFEEILIMQGIPLRHLQENKKIPAYQTNIELNSTGAFSGKTFVTMRQFSTLDSTKATTLTAQFPKFHGAPLHSGDCTQIGIKDLSKPDYGDTPTLYKDDIPLYWACGITVLQVIEKAEMPIAIVVNPGYMLITDLLVMSLCEARLDVIA